MKNKNKEMLDSFTEYCKENPRQRFFQALTNWMGVPYIGLAREPSGVGFIDLWNYEGE